MILPAAIPRRITLLADDPSLSLSREAFYRRSGETQRGRLLEAVTQVVAARGYAAATVSAIVAAAGVSRSTFYEHFDGKTDCLLESYRVATTIVIERIGKAAMTSASEGWDHALAAGVATYFQTIRDEPEIARAQFVELPAIGIDAIVARNAEQQRHMTQILLLAEAIRTTDPSTPQLDHGMLKLVLAGIDERVAQALAADPDQLEQRLAETETDALRALRAVAITA